MEQKNKNELKDERRAESSNDAGTPIYLTGDSTLQTPEEDQHDKGLDPRKNETFELSNDDLHETRADRMAGSDRAGTAERKE